MQIRTAFIGIVFVASVAASVATSYPPAWHLTDSVQGVVLNLTPEAPRATFVMTVTGNRAAFPDSFTSDGRFKLVAELKSMAAGESFVTLDSGLPVRLGAGATERMELSGLWDGRTPCTMDSCQRTVNITFALTSGGPVSGTFDVTVDLDGPDVPKDEAPDDPKIDLAVSRAP